MCSIFYIMYTNLYLKTGYCSSFQASKMFNLNDKYCLASLVNELWICHHGKKVVYIYCTMLYIYETIPLC